MADVKWTGRATAVAQVDTITPGGTIEADDIFILTVTGLNGTTTVISAAAGGTGASDVVTALKTAWNASTDTNCTGITASGTATLILTADTAGVPFSVAASSTEANGDAADDQTFIRAATTASAGPKHWDTVGNWDTGALPGGAASQNVYIENSADEILYGLDQSAIANALTSLNIDKSFTGKIGYNGAAGFPGTYLKIKASAVNIGQNMGGGTPAGSGRIMIDTVDTASVVTVTDLSTTATDTNKPCCRLKANSASTVINIKKGKVGIAFEAGEATTAGVVNITHLTNRASDANVYIGNATLTTLNKTGGTCVFNGTATTINNWSGNMTTSGSGAVATENQYGGYFYPNSTGTVTAFNAIGGTSDFTQSRAAKTVTTMKMEIGAILQLDPSVVTLTNFIQPYSATGNIKLTAAEVL